LHATVAVEGVDRRVDPAEADGLPDQVCVCDRRMPAALPLGIACDTGLVPDHVQIVDGFAAPFHRLAMAKR